MSTLALGKRGKTKINAEKDKKPRSIRKEIQNLTVDRSPLIRTITELKKNADKFAFIA